MKGSSLDTPRQVFPPRGVSRNRRGIAPRFRAASAVFFLLVAGCFGPMKLARSFDDWANELYTRSPWLAQVNVVLYPALMALGAWGDLVLFNAINFWGENSDWNGDGTPYNHKNPRVPYGKDPKP